MKEAKLVENHVKLWQKNISWIMPNFAEMWWPQNRELGCFPISPSSDVK